MCPVSSRVECSSRPVSYTHLDVYKRQVDGKTVTMTVKPGDKVITDKYAGTKVTLEDVEDVYKRQVHDDGAAAGDAALAHAAGHNGGVRGHAAADGEDALGGDHALDVLGAGLQTDPVSYTHLDVYKRQGSPGP